MALVREHYRVSHSGGADTVESPPPPTATGAGNVTVDATVAGASNVSYASQHSSPRASPPSRRLEASWEVLKARRRVLRRWRKAKKGPCPLLLEMSDERLLELDVELAAVREAHIRRVVAGTVSSSSCTPSRDEEPHSLEETRSSPDVISGTPDPDRPPRVEEALARDATPPSRDEDALEMRLPSHLVASLPPWRLCHPRTTRFPHKMHPRLTAALFALPTP